MSIIEMIESNQALYRENKSLKEKVERYQKYLSTIAKYMWFASNEVNFSIEARDEWMEDEEKFVSNDNPDYALILEMVKEFKNEKH